MLKGQEELLPELTEFHLRQQLHLTAPQNAKMSNREIQVDVCSVKNPMILPTVT